jgi:hypothetical protein
MSEFNTVKDSGHRQEFSTGAVRDTQEGKGRFDLLPAYAITRVAQHFENGARKYNDENWRKGIPLRRFLDSAIRHLFKLLEGQIDEDHAAAVAWNVLCLIETQEQIRRGNLPADLANLPDWTANAKRGHADEPAPVASVDAPPVSETIKDHPLFKVTHLDGADVNPPGAYYGYWKNRHHLALPYFYHLTAAGVEGLRADWGVSKVYAITTGLQPSEIMEFIDKGEFVACDHMGIPKDE